MAFRFNELGAMVVQDPQAAAERLVEVIAREGNLVSASRSLGVTGRTMRRWLGSLLEGGYDVRTRATEAQIDARNVARATGQPEPRQDLLARAARLAS